jgi:hypothetical protein
MSYPVDLQPLLKIGFTKGYFRDTMRMLPIVNHYLAQIPNNITNEHNEALSKTGF